MPITPLTKTVKDPEAVKSPDNSNTARKLFEENHEPVEFKIHASDEKGIELFQNLNHDLLPTVLPFGYKWAKSENSNISVIKTVDAKPHKLEVFVYGPDQGKINYNFLVDDVTQTSFAHTKQGNGPGNRDYPISCKDFSVPGFHYDDAKSHIRGHCIDHADTMLVGGRESFSTYDPKNYIPEPHYKYWGCQMRRLLVADIRKEKNGYMQYVHYPENPSITYNGTPVPDYLYFYPIGIDVSAPYSERYSKGEAFNIDWDVDYRALRPADSKVTEFAEDYTTKGAPTILLWDAAQSDRSARLQLRNASKRVDDIVSKNISSLYPRRDAMFVKTACAENEFESSKYRFFAASHASKENQGGLAENELNAGLDYSESLINADATKNIVDQAQLAALLGLFKIEAPGFKDPDDSQQDHLSQIFKDLGFK